MFGNLFTQKKYNENNQTPPAEGPVIGAPSAAPASFQSPPNQQLLSNQPNQPPVQPNQPSQSGENILGSSMKPNVRQDLSVMSHLDTRSAQVLNHAQEEAKRIKQPLIEPEQLLTGLLFDSGVFGLLGQFSVDVGNLSRELSQKEQMGNFTGQPMLSENSKKIFEDAYSSVKGRGVEFISPEDILITIFNQNSKVSSFLKDQGLEKDKIEEKLSKSSTFVYGKKSSLEHYGIDLTAEAKEGSLDPVAGREREIERVIHILLRRTKNNPIIIGEAGVGKTAIVEGLAQEIVSGKAPKDLAAKKIIQLDMSSLVAGASHRGEFEERLRGVVKETMASGTVILFIDEVHSLIGAGDNEGAMDASNIIKPFLARGQLQIIGTTTTAEYRKYFEKDKAFERRFQPVIVEEPSEERAIEMMKVIVPKYEEYHKVKMSPEAIEASVKLSKRYIGERYLPDKAVDLMDEAAAEVRLELNENKRQENQIKKSDIENVVSNWTGIPITKLTENESEKLLHLEDIIHKRLINQENAVGNVAEAVRRGRIGLSSANRPIASFIFLGPTGVGKTELAKTLAEVLFGKEDAMIRLDMSEYMEKHEVAKLIGAPPGYVGYEEGGQLTEAVRAKPYSIVLLDEVEKAHPDVFNILLQLLEDGRLTDNKGNTISFKNTIVIATSNIGSALIQQQLQEGLEKQQSDQKQPENQESKSNDIKKKFEELSKVLVTELRKFFKPELLNRFDGVVIFEPLTEKNMMEVAKLGINSTRKLLKLQAFDLEITDVALSRLAKEGYDPIYGARPLRRLIQTAIENPVALLIISKAFVAGDNIKIDYDETKEEFTFTKAPPKAQNAEAKDQESGNGQPADQNQQPGQDQGSFQNGQQVASSQPEVINQSVQSQDQSTTSQPVINQPQAGSPPAGEVSQESIQPPNNPFAAFVGQPQTPPAPSAGAGINQAQNASTNSTANGAAS